MKEKKSEPNESCAGDRLKAEELAHNNDVLRDVIAECLEVLNHFRDYLRYSLSTPMLDRADSVIKSATQIVELGDSLETVVSLKDRGLNRRVPEQQPNVGPNDGTCGLCGAETNSLTGNPSLWALDFPDPTKSTGVCKPWHMECVMKLVRAALSEQPQEQNLGEHGAVE